MSEEDPMAQVRKKFAENLLEEVRRSRAPIDELRRTFATDLLTAWTEGPGLKGLDAAQLADLVVRFLGEHTRP
jgi:hypothetical protein